MSGKVADLKRLLPAAAVVVWIIFLPSVIPIAILVQAALVGAALGFVAFVALYQSLTAGRWRRSRVGRNVMALMFVGAALLTLAVVREFFDFLDSYLEYVRYGSFALIGIVVWWRIVLLIAEQAEADSERLYDQEDPMTETPPPWYRYAAKAVTAFAALATVALGSLLVSITDDSLGGSSITTVEWVRLLIAVSGAAAGTYGVFKIPNDYGAKAAPYDEGGLAPGGVRKLPGDGSRIVAPPDRDTRPW